jgi:hypothetical protein
MSLVRSLKELHLVSRLASEKEDDGVASKTEKKRRDTQVRHTLKIIFQ